MPEIPHNFYVLAVDDLEVRAESILMPIPFNWLSKITKPAVTTA
jgi:hypothetical protein